MLRTVRNVALVPLAITLSAGCAQEQPKAPSAAGLPSTVLKELPSAGLPKPVLTAIEAEYPGASIVHHWRDAVDGQPVREVTLRQAGKCFDVSFTAEGKVVEVERPISERELPAAVSEVLAARHPNFRLVKAEEVCPSRGGLLYELSLATTGASVKSKYNVDGSLNSEITMCDVNK